MSITEILSLISLISFILSGISLLLAVILWFKLHIPEVLAELTGRVDKKVVKKDTRKSKQKKSESIQKKDLKKVDTKQNRVQISKPVGTVSEEETGLLQRDEQAIYNNAPKDFLRDSIQAQMEEETDLLWEETGFLEDTDLLEQVEIEKNKPGYVKLVILEEVMLIHTNKRID